MPRLIIHLLPLCLLPVLSQGWAAYTPEISAGTTVTSETVDGSQGNQQVYGTLTDSTITGNKAYSYINSGGKTRHITVTDGGTLYSLPGGQTEQTYVTQGGYLQINGSATDTTVDNGGQVYVNAGTSGAEDATQGGFATQTTVGNDGVMINRYGVDENTVVQSGGELDTGWDQQYETRDTAISRNAEIQNGGKQQVTNGGTSENSQVDAGGTLLVTGTLHYDSVTDTSTDWYYGTAINSAVSGEMQNLGGMDQDTQIQSGGAYLLDRGGQSSNLRVEQDGSAQINQGRLDNFWLAGSMSVSSQATLTGSGDVENGGELTLSEGAQTSGVDLTLAGDLVLSNWASTAGHSYSLDSLTMDDGSVYFDSASFATLNLSTLSGSGNFYMNTDIAGQQGDMINVSGEANGDFGILIADTGESPQDNQSLQIVHTGGGDAQFSLLNPDQQVDIGTWEYQLTPDDQGNWSLTPGATPTPTPSTDAVLALANVAPSIFQTELSALHNRLDAVRARPHDGEFWMQALSNRFDANRTGSAAYRQTLGGVVLGYDTRMPLRSGALTWGISGSYSRSDLDLSNDGDGSVDSYSAALYASYYDRSHVWLDGVLKGNIFNQHLSARMSSGGLADGSYTTPGIGGSLTTGYDFQLSRTTLSPFIGFSGFTAQGDDYRLSNGMQARPGTAKSALAQAGLRLSQHIAGQRGAEFTPWLKVSLEQEFVHNNEVRVNEDTFNNNCAGVRGSYQLGLNATLTPQTRLTASAQYQKGDGVESPWTGMLGFSHAF
ncbi:autotransporter outer membrane beta-barrel domain-containing protein [Citrobacter braakii]|nr:autotransporter outer membrane beta-barrel domain-containing protein [Citrobacter braakii]